MSIIWSTSVTTDILEYFRSVFRIAKLFRRVWPIVLRKYVFMRLSALKERSAEQDVAGIVAKILATWLNTGRTT